MSSQLELFHVQEAYAKADKPLSNEELYDSVAELAGIPKSALNEQSEIGKAKVKRSKLKRQIRWYQQTLKSITFSRRWTASEVSGSSQAKPRRTCMKRLVELDLSPVQQILGWRCGQTTRAFSLTSMSRCICV